MYRSIESSRMFGQCNAARGGPMQSSQLVESPLLTMHASLRRGLPQSHPDSCAHGGLTNLIFVQAPFAAIRCSPTPPVFAQFVIQHVKSAVCSYSPRVVVVCAAAAGQVQFVACDKMHRMRSCAATIQ
jgi:hypothetical protein